MDEPGNGDQSGTMAEHGQVDPARHGDRSGVGVAQDLPGTWCPRCGEPTHAGRSPAHDRCEAALRLEPPRYCHRCRRRMVVQVVPRGWEARCSQHGVVAVSS